MLYATLARIRRPTTGRLDSGVRAHTYRHAMTHFRPPLIAFLLLAPFVCTANDTLKLKTVELTIFMQGQLAKPIALPIPVPSDYESATIPDAPISYAYWMRPRDVEKTIRTGNLPSNNGYMYGKISLDVGYDKDSDLFIGFDDPKSIAQVRASFLSLTIERCHFKEHPVLLLKAAAPSSGNMVYAMYLATKIETNTIYLAIRPPQNSRYVGDQIFDALKGSLSACSKTASGP